MEIFYTVMKFKQQSNKYLQGITDGSEALTLAKKRTDSDWGKCFQNKKKYKDCTSRLMRLVIEFNTNTNKLDNVREIAHHIDI